MLIYVSLTLITREQSTVWPTHRSMLFDYWGNKIECVALWLLLQIGNSGSYHYKLFEVQNKTEDWVMMRTQTDWKLYEGNNNWTQGNKNCEHRSYVSINLLPFSFPFWNYELKKRNVFWKKKTSCLGLYNIFFC